MTKPAVAQTADPDPETERPGLPAPNRRAQLPPHEYVFGLFLALTWVRLVVRAGPFGSPSLAFLACTLTTLLVIRWSGRNPTPLRWRVRLLMYPILMGLSFILIPSAVARLELPIADARLVRWDEALLGTNVNLAIQSWEHPLVTDVMMLGYLFFFYYLIAGPARYCIRDMPRFRECFAGLFTIYGVGFIGYTILPAGGPHRFLEFPQPLPSGWIAHVAKPVVDACSNGIDAFPSIHVAVSLYLLMFDWRNDRRRFWRLLAPCIALWMSTIYLRYHYGVDVIAGVALAGLGLWVAVRYERSCAQTADLLHPMKAVPAPDGIRLGKSPLPARPRPGQAKSGDLREDRSFHA